MNKNEQLSCTIGEQICFGRYRAHNVTLQSSLLCLAGAKKEDTINHIFMLSSRNLHNIFCGRLIFLNVTRTFECERTIRSGAPQTDWKSMNLEMIEIYASNCPNFAQNVYKNKAVTIIISSPRLSIDLLYL